MFAVKAQSTYQSYLWRSNAAQHTIHLHVLQAFLALQVYTDRKASQHLSTCGQRSPLGIRIIMRRKNVEKLAQSLTSWEDGLARLGECVVQFQRIEAALSMCISAMVGRSRKVGEILTSEMSFRARVAIFGALFAHSLKSVTLPDDITELISRLHWAEGQRNTLVHSLWDASESKPDSIRREKRSIRKSKLAVVEEHFTPDDLEELNGLFEGIVTDLFYLSSIHLPKIKKRLP